LLFLTALLAVGGTAGLSYPRDDGTVCPEPVVPLPIYHERPDKDPINFIQVGQGVQVGTLYRAVTYENDWCKCGKYLVACFGGPAGPVQVGYCAEQFLRAMSVSGHVEVGLTGLSIWARLNWYPSEGIHVTFEWDLWKGAATFWVVGYL
jgi:hypothetical protein